MERVMRMEKAVPSLGLMNASEQIWSEKSEHVTSYERPRYEH